MKTVTDHTNILKEIGSELSRLGKLAESNSEFDVSFSADLKKGDVFSNIALKHFKQMGFNSPMEAAEKIAAEYNAMEDPCIENVEAAKPGFVNFFLSKNYLQGSLSSILKEKDAFGNSNLLEGRKIMVEFAHPNTHKEFHIGHMRNITTGEAISRILASQGADLSRVNYQGDVGMHVAKALYGVRKKLEEGETIEAVDSKTSDEKAKFLGESYALGSKYYEEDEEAKKEIGEINKQIYAKEPEVYALWEKTRKWSLEYFESIYKRVDTHFDRFFFESEVYESGRETVLSHVDDGIFVKDQGAIIFPGEKFGLHNRVFVTSEGNPTYEGKEMGLGPLQYKESHFDQALHVVGPEQAGYFQVVFKALEEVFPELKGKEHHISYGFVQLKEGKMSSRLGNIIRGEWMLDEAKERILDSFPDISESVAEEIAVGAVKYSMLKVGREANIQFSFEESINLHGNSGPYIQYAYARTQNVLNKSQEPRTESHVEIQDVNSEESELLRMLVRFPDVVSEAADTFAPSTICTYLYELSQAFNLFYEKHKVIGSEHEAFRLSLTAAVGQVLKNGLTLLGISAPAKI